MQTIAQKKALHQCVVMLDHKNNKPRNEPYVGRLLVGCLLILLVGVMVS